MTQALRTDSRSSWPTRQDGRVSRLPELTAALTEATTRAVTAIAAVPGGWCPSLSPDGTEVAYVTDRSGAPRVEVASLAAEDHDWRVVSPRGHEAISVAWSPDGRYLAYLVSPGGSIRAELHVVRPDGTGHRLLAGGRPGETVFAGGWISPTCYSFSLADGRSPHAVVHLVDVDTGAFTPVPSTAGRGFFVVTSVSWDGRRVLARRGPRGHRHLVLAEVGAPAEQEPIRLLAADFPDETDDLGEDGRFTPHGRVFLRTNAGRDRMALASVPLDEDGVPGRMTVRAERDDADLEGYAIGADGRTAILVWNVGGTSELEVADLLDPAAGWTVPLPEQVLPGWSLQGDGRGMILELTGPCSPRSLYRVDLPGWDAGFAAVSGVDGGAVYTAGGISGGSGKDGASAPPLHLTDTPVAVPEDPPVSLRLGTAHRLAAMPSTADLPDLVLPTRQRYRAPDGTPLEGWLYRPRDAHGPEPTVISFHGGPESQERPAYGLLIQSMVSSGMTVFAPNVRGSSGYGRAFMESDDAAARPDSFQDIPATVDFLVDSGLARPGAIGVQGWSYGGYLVLTALTRWPELFAAGATHAGMSDLLSFFAETEPWMAAASVTEYGDPAGQADLLRALSPLTHLDRVRAPVLLVHGDQDTNVPVNESIRAHAALHAAGVPTDLLLLPGEGHTIVGAEQRTQLALSVTRWFSRWMG